MSNHHTPISTAIHSALRPKQYPRIPSEKVTNWVAKAALEYLIAAAKVLRTNPDDAEENIDLVITRLVELTTGGVPLPAAEPVSDLNANFDLARFAREVRKATLPTHVVETQEEADQINEWIAMITDIREVHFDVGDHFHLLPMHAG